MTRPASSVGAIAVVLALSLSVGRLHARLDEEAEHGPGRIDLAASALPGPDQPDALDNAWLDSRSGHRAAQVDTTASANAGCDGCSATATALHITYLDRPTATTLDNVSAAWAQCTGCRATAVSVQVVVLRSPQDVRANNRALAMNVACDGCHSASAAFQLIVVSEHRERLSATDVQQLRQWVADLASALHVEATSTASAAGASASGAGTLDQLEALVGGGLGGAQTLQRDADVQTGADPSPAPQEPAPAPSGPDTTA